MRKPSSTSTSSRPSSTPQLTLSRTARRDIRHMAKLAREADFYAFRTHRDGSVTWIPRRSSTPGKPEPKGKDCDELLEPSGESKRKLCSLSRAAAHAELTKRARDFRVRSVLRWWSATSSTSSPSDAIMN